MNKKPKNVDAYITSAPKEIRGKLKDLRTAIRLAAPKAEEKISYGMPYYSYKGKLAYFAYFKNHIGFYAMHDVLNDFKDEVKDLKTGRATIHLDLNKKLPIALIKKIVRKTAKKNEESVW